MIRRRLSRSADERLLRRTVRRVGVQTAAGIALTVLVLAAIAVLVELYNQHRAQDDLIAGAIARADDVGDPPEGMWLVTLQDGTRSASPGLPPGLPDEAALRRTAADQTPRTADRRVEHREYRVRTEPRGAHGAVQAVLDLSAAHAERSRLLEALLVTGALGLVLATATGAWLARRAVAPMAEALALQRRFVADAGHELRTPLTLLSTRAQLLRRNLDRQAGRAQLESDAQRLVQDAAQLAAILDDLLLAADPREAAGYPPIDLSELVSQVADAVQPTADRRGVAVLTVTPGAALPAVPGSATSLRRAVTALLDNAVRHARSEVRLALSVHGEQLAVDVTDDGPGIEPGMLPTIFDRFVAAPADGASAGSRRYGLGLALVSEIAARHGGSVSVVHAGRAGATFRLLIALQPRTSHLPRVLHPRHQENSQNSPAP